jgi:hypothetical protein
MYSFCSRHINPSTTHLQTNVHSLQRWHPACTRATMMESCIRQYCLPTPTCCYLPPAAATAGAPGVLLLPVLPLLLLLLLLLGPPLHQPHQGRGGDSWRSSARSSARRARTWRVRGSAATSTSSASSSPWQQWQHVGWGYSDKCHVLLHPKGLSKCHVLHAAQWTLRRRAGVPGVHTLSCAGPGSPSSLL